MTDRFTVQIEKNMKSACILDTKTTQIYMLMKFTITDKKTSKKAYVDNLYEICRIMNNLHEENIRLRHGH